MQTFAMNRTTNPERSAPDRKRFSERLLAWYDAHARDLPWRQRPGTRRPPPDPYGIWLSEIMLQQTRVAAVIEHYHEFLRRFPTVRKLAAARESSVLAAWSGLGYYRRARMLHQAARLIVRERSGKFPENAAGWRELPGIGRYSSAAIASIAFNEPVAVVDGNVERVLQRIAGERLSGEELWSTAQDLLDPRRPGDFNQAMMELGATVCTPRAPACLTCPIVDFCATRGELAITAKAERQQKREVHYALCLRDGSVYLTQRPRDASLMAGLWELPEIAPPGLCGSEKQFPRSARNDRSGARRSRNEKREASAEQPLFTLRHSITVTNYTVRVWNRAAMLEIPGQWITVERLNRIALTGLARKILLKVEVIARLKPAV
jgi:A/G-specific adenine glycosylase